MSGRSRRPFFRISVLAGVLTVAIRGATPALAEGGADDLLRALGTNPAAPAGSAGGLSAGTPELALDRTQFKLDDTFTQEFFITFASQRGLPGEVRQWGMKVLKGEFAQAAHLWTAIQPQMPESLFQSARAAQLYSLWRLGLSQTFFDQWLEALHSPKFRETRDEVALERVILPGMDRWLLDAAIVLSPEQRTFVQTLDPASSEIHAVLRAFRALRSGTAGMDLLERIPVQSALKLPVTETVTLALARAGDLPGAAKVLKQHLEPALMARKDPKLLAEHYIQIARLLYQAGSLEGAEQYYSKIPNGIPAFFNAREELTWVWLKKGDVSRLRGELASLKSPVFAERFSPELYLVRAISNLKLCYYDDVEQDFRLFVSQNAKWAREISQAMSAQDPPAPPEKDFYTQLLDRAVANRLAESALLDRLGEESIAAALPAVGWQLHWKKSRENLGTLLGALQKQRADEYRRQWKNRQAVLVEAMRKMQFVKVEVMSQLHELAAANNRDTIRVTTAAAKTAAPENDSRADEQPTVNEDGKMVFPYDGVYWPDELFRLRSITRGKCLR